MNDIDQEQARRVWQRVRGGEATLGEIIELEWKNYGALENLARRATGERSAGMIRMSRVSRSHWAILRGIRALTTGKREPPEGKKECSQPLVNSYTRARQCQEFYGARRNDPDFGEIFRYLWQESIEQCRSLLELMGQ